MNFLSEVLTGFGHCNKGRASRLLAEDQLVLRTFRFVFVAHGSTN